MRTLTVADLKAAIAGLPDATPVMVEVRFDEGDGYEIAGLEKVGVEERCAGDPVLYLLGDADEDIEDEEAPET